MDTRTLGLKRIYDKHVGNPAPDGHYIGWKTIWQGICYRCGEVWANHQEPNGNSDEAVCYGDNSELDYL